MTDEEFVRRACEVSDTLDSDWADWALEELVADYRGVEDVACGHQGLECQWSKCGEKAVTERG